MIKLTDRLGLVSLGLLLASATACSAASSDGDGGGDGAGQGPAAGDGTPAGAGPVIGGEGSDISVTPGGDVEGEPGVNEGGDPNNPASCDIAAESKTYVGCDFWPTQTTNKVHEEFKFAVVVANGGTETATVTAQGGDLAAAVPYEVLPGGLTVIELPWVAALKGPVWAASNTSGGREAANTQTVDGGAYHLTSDIPITAWQFNPLEFSIEKFAGCFTSFEQDACFSVSNDASILIPSTAMTGNYRIYGYPALKGEAFGSMPGGLAITATQNDTVVEVQFGLECETGVNDAASQTGECTTGVDGVTKFASDIESFTLQAADVLHYIGARGPGSTLAHADLSGSLVKADKPVQVISFNPLTQVPDNTGNADHIEEIVLPAEVLGFDYVVAAPTSPSGQVKGGHAVRMVGNFAETTLTYENKPAGAPDSLGVGETVEFTTTEAVVAGYKIARVPLAAKLDNPNNETGSHRLESDLPVGLQVMGFGHATSYYYPGGLDLEPISVVPEVDPVIIR